MPRTIHLCNPYPYPAALVWHVATDLDHLKRAVKSKVRFRNLPSGSIYQGQSLNVDVSLFGVLPFQPYQMTVVSFDPDAFRFVSNEKGAGVKAWNHTLQVVDHGDHCEIHEHIEIDAGALTTAFCLWAKILYQGRHGPRLSILKDLSQNHRDTQHGTAS